MFEEPKRLVPGSIVDGFIHDPNMSWVVAYAGPCDDPECKEKHRRLFLVPMLGWFQVIIDDHLIIRPAVMGSNGTVVDYMEFPDLILFVAVLKKNDETIDIAREIYHARYGDAEQIITEPEPIEALPN